MSASIDAEKFAANLRAEMGRQGVSRVRLFSILNESSAPGFGPGTLGYLAQIVDGHTTPTPDEIEAIASALGCSVERLTVSREELEAESARLRAGLDAILDHVGRTPPRGGGADVLTTERLGWQREIRGLAKKALKDAAQ